MPYTSTIYITICVYALRLEHLALFNINNNNLNQPEPISNIRKPALGIFSRPVNVTEAYYNCYTAEKIKPRNISQTIGIPCVSFNQLSVQKLFNFFFLPAKLCRVNTLTIYQSRRHLAVTMHLDVVKDVNYSLIIAQTLPAW